MKTDSLSWKVVETWTTNEFRLENNRFSLCHLVQETIKKGLSEPIPLNVACQTIRAITAELITPFSHLIEQAGLWPESRSTAYYQSIRNTYSYSPLPMSMQEISQKAYKAVFLTFRHVFRKAPVNPDSTNQTLHLSLIQSVKEKNRAAALEFLSHLPQLDPILMPLDKQADLLNLLFEGNLEDETFKETVRKSSSSYAPQILNFPEVLKGHLSLVKRPSLTALLTLYNNTLEEERTEVFEAAKLLLSSAPKISQYTDYVYLIKQVRKLPKGQRKEICQALQNLLGDGSYSSKWGILSDIQLAPEAGVAILESLHAFSKTHCALLRKAIRTLVGLTSGRDPFLAALKCWDQNPDAFIDQLLASQENYATVLLSWFKYDRFFWLGPFYQLLLPLNPAQRKQVYEPLKTCIHKWDSENLAVFQELLQTTPLSAWSDLCLCIQPFDMCDKQAAQLLLHRLVNDDQTEQSELCQAMAEWRNVHYTNLESAISALKVIPKGQKLTFVRALLKLCWQDLSILETCSAEKRQTLLEAIVLISELAPSRYVGQEILKHTQQLSSSAEMALYPRAFLILHQNQTRHFNLCDLNAQLQKALRVIPSQKKESYCQFLLTFPDSHLLQLLTLFENWPESGRADLLMAIQALGSLDNPQIGSSSLTQSQQLVLRFLENVCGMQSLELISATFNKSTPQILLFVLKNISDIPILVKVIYTLGKERKEDLHIFFEHLKCAPNPTNYIKAVSLIGLSVSKKGWSPFLSCLSLESPKQLEACCQAVVNIFNQAKKLCLSMDVMGIIPHVIGLSAEERQEIERVACTLIPTKLLYFWKLPFMMAAIRLAPHQERLTRCEIILKLVNIPDWEQVEKFMQLSNTLSLQEFQEAAEITFSKGVVV